MNQGSAPTGANHSALLSCLRWDADAQLRALPPEQWTELYDLLRREAGTHFLGRRLRHTGIQPPPEIAQRLRERSLDLAVRNLSGKAIIAKAAKETGRPLLILKGIDLAERVYGGLGERAMGDVDVLAHQDDIAVFDAWFRAQRYAANRVFNASLLVSEREHHVGYKPPSAGQLLVELHWRLVEEETNDRLDYAGIWQRASQSWAPGVLQMSPEDLVLYLCLHLENHSFETPLTQLWDFAEIVEGQSMPVDWPLLMQRANEWNMRETVQISLFLAARTLGFKIDHITDWQPPAVDFLPEMLPRLGVFPYGEHIHGHRMAVFFSPESSWKERWHAFRQGMLPPSAELRAKYGNASRPKLYYRHFRYHLRSKFKAVLGLVTGSRTAKGQITRIAALRRHLKTHKRPSSGA